MLCPMLIPLCSILQRLAETFDYYSRPIRAVITACLMPSGVFHTRNLAVETQNIQATLLGDALFRMCSHSRVAYKGNLIDKQRKSGFVVMCCV